MTTMECELCGAEQPEDGPELMEVKITVRKGGLSFSELSTVNVCLPCAEAIASAFDLQTEDVEAILADILRKDRNA